MKYLILNFAVVLLCWPVHAEESVQVFYSKAVPATVRQQIPRRGKTVYFGSCVFKKAEPKILFHLYSYPVSSKSGENKVDLVNSLDIFEQTTVRRRSSLKLINTVRFHAEFSERLSADVTWVNSKRHRIPILRIDSDNKDWSFGHYGSYLFINFPAGLRRRATVQRFEYESNNSGMHSVKFGEDDRGYLTITTTKTDVDGEETTKGIYEWSRDRFGSPTTETLNIK